MRSLTHAPHDPRLTSWCAALGLEQLRASVVLLRKAEVGDLEVGVVLLVHKEQVLRLKR